MNYTDLFFFGFVVWSFPLGVIRSRFRKMVYETESWTIIIKPVFVKEFRVLFGDHDFKSPEDLRLVRFYRLYLIVYFLLLGGMFYFR